MNRIYQKPALDVDEIELQSVVAASATLEDFQDEEIQFDED